MEVSELTIGVFYISKILALAPYSLRKNSKGKIEIRRSIPFAFYSVSLILIMIFLTYRGLLFDANSKIPVRMKSATSKVVTALDVSVVVLSTSAGVICGLIGLKSTQEFNKRLDEVDEILHSFVSPRMEQVRAYAMAFLSLLFISVLLGFDISTWIRVAVDMKIDEENTEMNVQWYIPFYSLYYMLTGLQISIAHTTFGVGRRYRRLNLTLKKLFLTDETSGNKVPTFYKKVDAVRTVSMSQNDTSGTVKKAFIDAQSNNTTSCNILARLAGIHESLSICVQMISEAYGLAILFILVSCLLHLVATAYFLFLEFLSNKNTVYSWLQVLWIVFHAARLLMVVEPCHLTTMEARQTILLLCQINRAPHDDELTECNQPRRTSSKNKKKMVSKLSERRMGFSLTRKHMPSKLKPSFPSAAACVNKVDYNTPITLSRRIMSNKKYLQMIRKFWQQLLADRTTFSACGLCSVNRELLTSISGAIATYLVILIQFQKSNG